MNKILYLLLVVLYLPVRESIADDIDVVVNGSNPEGAPYLHVVLDSSLTAFNPLCTYGTTGSCAPPFMSQASYANLRQGHSVGDSISRFEIFTAVLTSLFENPLFEQINVSLLISDRDYGARMLSPYKRLGQGYDGVNGAQLLISAMNAVSVSDSLGSPHDFQAKDAFYIWYRYLNGESPPGIEGFTGAEPTACSKFFSIVMATESTTEDGILNSDLRRDLSLPASGRLGFVHVLEKMHSGTVDLAKESLAGINSLAKTWVAAPATGVDLAREWARVGGGGGPANLDDPAELERRLNIALLKLININRTNVAPGYPMTAFGRTVATRDLYVPLYKPLATLRWPGNVKKFKLNPRSTSAESGPHVIADFRGEPALVSSGPGKGQITGGAVSFWTDVVSLPLSGSEEIPNGADGPAVDRGGAGQQIPGFISGGGSVIGAGNGEGGARQLWVEPTTIVNGGVNTLLPFNADGTAEGSTAVRLLPSLGVSGAEEAERLIRWGRGLDVDDADGDGFSGDARPWLMGGVLHSRPLALNYGAVAGYSAENPNIRVFVGTVDGIFHAIENTTNAGEESGREVFGFYPDESLANIASLRENALSSLEMRYGVDGSPVSFAVDNNGDGNLNHESPDNDEVYVYFGMRRGGYSYYALDVSDTSAAPALKWKISRSLGGGDFSELGLTFSRPTVGKVKFKEQALDVLIFAGGYHGGWDSGYDNRVGKDLSDDDDVSSDGSVSIGNAIYIVNARTGELVWKAVYGSITSNAITSTNTQFRHAQLVDSIPSSVSAVKNSGGIIHRLYVGDTGGAIWRVDLPAAMGPANPDHRRESWFISKLAELGTDGLATDRRFFHAPDLIRSKLNDGTAFDGILISSGDRAAPNNTDVVDYHLYIKDYLVATGDDAARVRPAITISDNAEDSGLPDRTACTGGSSADQDFHCALSTENGWMIKMTRPGEKGLSSPLVDGGKVFFSSYVPVVPRPCSAVAGEGYSYLVNLEDASAVIPTGRFFHLGSGIPSAVMTLEDQLLVPLGGIGEIEQGDCEGVLCSRSSTSLHKIYWREPGVDEF